MYKLLFFESKALSKDRKKLQRNAKMSGVIQEALGKLAVDPFAMGCFDVKKLRGSPEQGIFRLRVGAWRILFDVDTGNKNVIVYRIRQRKEGY